MVRGAQVDLGNGVLLSRIRNNLAHVLRMQVQDYTNSWRNKAFGKYTDVSRLFIYKTTRDLMGVKGDTGGYLRTTLGALALFGAPPEKYWPYNVANFDTEPCVSIWFADNFNAIKYVRPDPARCMIICSCLWGKLYNWACSIGKLNKNDSPRPVQQFLDCCYNINHYLDHFGNSQITLSPYQKSSGGRAVITFRADEVRHINKAVYGHLQRS